MSDNASAKSLDPGVSRISWNGLVTAKPPAMLKTDGFAFSSPRLRPRGSIEPNTKEETLAVVRPTKHTPR